MSTQSIGHDVLMDGVYRYQRHIYDLTRKFYLLGRDQLIHDLRPPVGGSVLEVGCGTGRNLLEIARRHPTTRCVGVDISNAMLDTAARHTQRAGLDGRVGYIKGDATHLDTLDIGTFDRVVFSYTLSMMPDWYSALRQGFERLGKGGSVHVVDFGNMRRLPRPIRTALHGWLARFHVSPRTEIDVVIREMAQLYGALVVSHTGYRGYFYSAIAAMPPGTALGLA